MDERGEIVLDHLGRVFMTCARCREPLRKADFWDTGLRLPEYGESAEAYCDAELLDELIHPACVGVPVAS